MNLIDVLIIVFALGLAGLGWERGLIRSAPPLIGFVAGAALGGRLGPELLADGSESAHAPVITVICGLRLGAAFAVAMEGVGAALHEPGRHGRRAATRCLGSLGLVGRLARVAAEMLDGLFKPTGSGVVQRRAQSAPLALGWSAER